jgi:hypothetical protein
MVHSYYSSHGAKRRHSVSEGAFLAGFSAFVRNRRALCGYFRAGSMACWFLLSPLCYP